MPTHNFVVNTTLSVNREECLVSLVTKQTNLFFLDDIQAVMSVTFCQVYYCVPDIEPVNVNHLWKYIKEWYC